ncbi:MAG TPA: type IV pilus twitching motility protein PilT [Myxococcota bacterium]|nr:type IV pilus twitching motility protein PilT [Myxococcota bacterium]
MSKQDQSLIGRLAVHYKMITMDQLAAVTREQSRQGGGKLLGDLLVEKGLLRPMQLSQLLKVQAQVLAKQQAGGTAAKAPPGAGAPGPQEGTDRLAPPAQRAPSERRPAAPPATAEPSAAERPKPLPCPAAKAPASSGRGVQGVPSQPKVELDCILAAATGAGISDIHVHSGAPLRHRAHGRLLDPEGEPIDAVTAERMIFSILSEEQCGLLRDRGELDLCYTLSGVARFRANLYHQQRGWDGVFRVIPPEPPTLEQLGLPVSFAKLTNYSQGMLLVTGPAGCGKSSTMAALVNLINEERRDHILTIEDPIEYLHPSKRCLLNQRSVRRHTESFARALRAALREDPDVIVIGELRDLETISLAMTAAETGHLVLATLHTNDTIRTINRLVGAFPSDQQSQIRTMISESLRAVISQRLLPTVDGTRRVPAYELLKVNKAVGNLIRENKTFQIRSILQTGAAQGMGLLDDSIAQLVKAGTVAREEALRHCEDAKKLAA